MWVWLRLLSGLVFHCSLLNWPSYHREANWRGITSTSLNDMLAADTEDSLLQQQWVKLSVPLGGLLSFTCFLARRGGLLITREQTAEYCVLFWRLWKRSGKTRIDLKWRKHFHIIIIIRTAFYASSWWVHLSREIKRLRRSSGGRRIYISLHNMLVKCSHIR